MMDLFMRALQQAPNAQGFRKSRILMVRASYPELKSTVIKSFQDWFPDSICPLRMNEAPITGLMTLPLPDKTVAHIEWVFVALDKPKDLAKLLSLEITSAGLCEAKELGKEVIDTVTSRIGRYPSMREGGPSWCGAIADTNAPSELSWWAELEKDPPENWRFYRQPPAMFKDETHSTGYVPNPEAENVANLPGGHQYYYNALGGKGEPWIRAYILNQFAATQAGKAVYGDLWSTDTHVAKAPLLPFKNVPVVVGLDFGLTPAAVFTQMHEGQLRIIHEVVAKRMGLEQFLTIDLLPLIGQVYYDNEVSFVGDPSGAKGADTDAKSCFDVMVKFGLPAVPAHSNALDPRLGAVRTYLTTMAPGGKPGLTVSPSCRTIIEGFEGGYQYAKIQVTGEDRYRDKPDKNSYSHPHDALQYACLRHQILSKRHRHVETYTQQWQPADMQTGY
jgi:hypothetical protein